MSPRVHIQLSPLAGGQVLVRQLRQDLPPGEPGSLHDQCELRPGESVSMTVPPGAALVITELEPRG